MTGTSGSSSDVALTTLYAADRAKLPWMAPGLDSQAGMDAMVDLSLQFFRTEGSSPSVTMARGMNRVRSGAGLPPKEVDAHQVFSHSYAEIDAGVRLTLEGVDPADEGAVEQSLGRSDFGGEGSPRSRTQRATAEPRLLTSGLATPDRLTCSAGRRSVPFDRSGRFFAGWHCYCRSLFGHRTAPVDEPRHERAAASIEPGTAQISR